MIEPLRLRSVHEATVYKEVPSIPLCTPCKTRQIRTPALIVCLDCRERPYCSECFKRSHQRPAKWGHRGCELVQSPAVEVDVQAIGDMKTFGKPFDWVQLRYTARVGDEILDGERSVTYQMYCSGPCIHLQVLGLVDVAVADLTGASDPYVGVYWVYDGVEYLVGTTPVKYMNCNAVWTNQTFVLPMDEGLLLEWQMRLGIENSPGRAADDVHLPRLRLDLFDYDKFSKNDFLGQILLSSDDIIGIMDPENYNQVETLEDKPPLSRRQSKQQLEALTRAARTVQDDEDDCPEKLLPWRPRRAQGEVAIKVARRDRKILVQICEGRELEQADPFSLSDPYCKIYWNGEFVGKTRRIDNTLNPLWTNEVCSFTPKESTDEDTLKVQVYDWDRFSEHDLLGEFELSGQILERLFDKADSVDDEDASTSSSGLFVALKNRFLEAERRRREQRLANTAPTLSESIMQLQRSVRELFGAIQDSGDRAFPPESLPVRLFLNQDLRNLDEFHVDEAPDDFSSIAPMEGVAIGYENDYITVLVDTEDNQPTVAHVGEGAETAIEVAEDALAAAQAFWQSPWGKPGLHERWLRHCRRAGLKPTPLNQASTYNLGEASWFALQASKRRSGEGFVKGCARLRFLWHKRGQVIRGLDEALQRLSLGCRATITLRHDFAFGDSIVTPSADERARIAYDVELQSIGNKGALVYKVKETLDRCREAVKQRIRALLFQVYQRVSWTFLERLLRALGNDEEEDEPPSVDLQGVGKLVQLQDDILLALQRRRLLRQIHSEQ